jgi:enoyl-[acyl-carrier-protein] reductase (NADH)
MIKHNIVADEKPKRRHEMNKIARRLEDLFTEMTFAEDRQMNTAGDAVKKAAQRIEDIFTVIAFAEAGEFETAASYINSDGEAPRSRRAGYPPRRFNKLCSGRA